MSKPDAAKIEGDAKGQFAGTQHGGKNNGVSSATPRVTTGTDDATFKNHPDGGASDKDQDGKSPAHAGLKSQ